MFDAHDAREWGDLKWWWWSSINKRYARLHANSEKLSRNLVSSANTGENWNARYTNETRGTSEIFLRAMKKKLIQCREIFVQKCFAVPAKLSPRTKFIQAYYEAWRIVQRLIHTHTLTLLKIVLRNDRMEGNKGGGKEGRKEGGKKGRRKEMK